MQPTKVSGSLREHLLGRITAEGPLTFAEFMEVALYHPVHGFYAARAPGEGAGYRTSPTLTPLFGRLLGRFVELAWRTLGEPREMRVVEAGPGDGSLVAAVHQSAPEPLRRSLVWGLVERFPHMTSIQQERLSRAGVPAAWAAELSEVTGAHLVVANEVLDNFPVHVFEMGADGPLEVMVSMSDGELAETLAPPLSPALAEMAKDAAAHLGEGDRFEARTSIAPWCHEAAAAIESGYLCIIDYGDERPEIWTKRPAGTLVTYLGEDMGHNPLAGPGGADITAHVDFTSLSDAVISAGFEEARITTQRNFLIGLGLQEIDESLIASRREAEAEGRHADALALVAERGRLGALAARHGMGAFKVLIARKNAPALSSFSF